MMKVGRILRDYAEAGAVNSLLALWGFVDEHTFLTKAGHVGVVYQMRGPDAEGLTHAQRQGLVHQFEAALRLLDEHCRVYQYVVKQTVEPFTAPSSVRVVAQDALRRRTDDLNERRSELFRVDHYLVLLYERPTTLRSGVSVRRTWRSLGAALRDRLSTIRTCAILESELERAVGTLHHKARALEVQLSRLRPSAIGPSGRFSILPAPGQLRRRRRSPPRLSSTTRIWTISSRTPRSSVTVIA